MVQETPSGTETEDSEGSGTTNDGLCEECGGCYNDECSCQKDMDRL